MRPRPTSLPLAFLLAAAAACGDDGGAAIDAAPGDDAAAPDAAVDAQAIDAPAIDAPANLRTLTSTAAYDARWLDAQRRVATQLGRAPHQRGLGVDGWMALLPFFALVVEGLARILGDDQPVLALQAAWRKAMQIHLTAWVTAAA